MAYDMMNMIDDLRSMLRRVLDCGAMQEDANDEETRGLYDEAEALLEQTK